jgi:hypothetical protein
MLLKLHSSTAMGVPVIDQILEHIKEMIFCENWLESMRKPDEVVTELDEVVSNEQFESVLGQYHIFLYVGLPEELPKSFAGFYNKQPFKDWIFLLKPIDNHMADPIYLFSSQSLQKAVLH